MAKAEAISKRTRYLSLQIVITTAIDWPQIAVGTLKAIHVLEGGIAGNQWTLESLVG